MSRSRTFRKNTKSHRKKSNVRKSRSFRKKRNAMRGGSYEKLLEFLKTRELTNLSTYFSKCSQIDKDKAVALFNEHKDDPDTLVKKLNSLMPSRVAVFGNPPAAAAAAAAAAPSSNDFYYNQDYENALYVANHNKTRFPDTWKTKLDTNFETPFETPEEYAHAFATRSQIREPPAQSQPFVRPPPGTYGGV
jgi:hypothetical protein